MKRLSKGYCTGETGKTGKKGQVSKNKQPFFLVSPVFPVNTSRPFSVSSVNPCAFRMPHLA